MNCKPGDLAVIVRSDANNHGKLVQVLRAATPSEFMGFIHLGEGHHWWVESMSGPIASTRGELRTQTALPDCRLRPIRPGDVTDDEVRELYAPKVPEAA